MYYINIANVYVFDATEKHVIAVPKVGNKLECKLEYNTVYHSLRTRPRKREESVIIPLGKRKSACKRNFTEGSSVAECL